MISLYALTPCSLASQRVWVVDLLLQHGSGSLGINCHANFCRHLAFRMWTPHSQKQHITILFVFLAHPLKACCHWQSNIHWSNYWPPVSFMPKNANSGTTSLGRKFENGNVKKQTYNRKIHKLILSFWISSYFIISHAINIYIKIHIILHLYNHIYIYILGASRTSKK